MLHDGPMGASSVRREPGGGPNGEDILVSETGDAFAPRVLDTPEIEIVRGNGQSWQTIDNHSPRRLDDEDPTGAARAALQAHRTVGVLALRRQRPYTPKFNPYRLPHLSRLPHKQSPSSDGCRVDDLHPIDLGGGFTVLEAALSAREVWQARWGLPRRATVAWGAGWGGGHHSLFLPESAGGAVAREGDATDVDPSTSYFWDRDRRTRDQIERIVLERYGRTSLYRHRTWLQGPSKSEAQYREFLETMRRVEDATPEGPLHAFNDQGIAPTDTPHLAAGAMAQLRFAQANASGRDWLVGPRHPFRLTGTVHHSSMGSLLLAEMTGLAMAEVERFGDWTPLWTREEDVRVSGRTITIETSRPRHGDGRLFVSRELTRLRAHGFALRDRGRNAAVRIASVAFQGTSITIEAATDLPSSLGIEYAFRGVVQPDGRKSAPSHSAAWGNVRMRSTLDRALIPGRIEYALCAFRYEIGL